MRLGEPPETRPRGRCNWSSLHKHNTEDYVKTVALFSPAAVNSRTTPSNRKDGADRLTHYEFFNQQQNRFMRLC